MGRDRRTAWLTLAALLAVTVLAVAAVQVLVTSGLSRSLVVRVGSAALLGGVALTVVAHPRIGAVVSKAQGSDSRRP